MAKQEEKKRVYEPLTEDQVSQSKLNFTDQNGIWNHRWKPSSKLDPIREGISYFETFH